MSLKRYRDLKGVIDTSFYEGLEKGEQIGLEKGEQIGDYKRAVAVARKCIAKGMSDEDFSEI